MKTSYIWKALHEPVPETIYVSIHLSKPKYMSHILRYEAVMPTMEMINIAHDGNYSAESLKRYKEKYFKKLSKLDPWEVFADLEGTTVLCSESAKDLASGLKYCHRQMLAGWIEMETGIVVPEELRESEKNLIIPAIYPGWKREEE